MLEPVLDFRTAKDNPVLVHPEDNWHMLCDLGGDNTRNLVGTTSDAGGDIEAVLADCDVVLERTYHTKAYNQAMMETFRTFTQLDRYGRLHVISSTQIVYHVRRILSHALGIPKAASAWRSRASAAASARSRPRCARCTPRSSP